MTKIKDIMPEIQEEFTEELKNEVKKVLLEMEKEIAATELVLENMKKKYAEIQEMDLKEFVMKLKNKQTYYLPPALDD